MKKTSTLDTAKDTTRTWCYVHVKNTGYRKELCIRDSQLEEHRVNNSEASKCLGKLHAHMHK